MRRWGTRPGGAFRLPVRMLAAAVLVLLTGCLKLDADLAVNSDNTITGDYVVAYLKNPDRPGSGLTSVDDLLVSRGSATASRYDDGEYEGVRYRLEGVPLADLAAFRPVRFEDRQTGTIDIRRDGNDFVVGGRFDFRERERIERTPEEQQAAEDAFTVRVRLTFPGDVLTGNGGIDGRTVSWDIRPFVLTTLQARASAVPPPPFAEPADELSTALLAGGLGLLGLAVLLALVLVVAWRRRVRAARARRRELEAEPDPATGPADFAWVVEDRRPPGRGRGSNRPPTGWPTHDTAQDGATPYRAPPYVPPSPDPGRSGPGWYDPVPYAPAPYQDSWGGPSTAGSPPSGLAPYGPAPSWPAPSWPTPSWPSTERDPPVHRPVRMPHQVPQPADEDSSPDRADGGPTHQ